MQDEIRFVDLKYVNGHKLGFSHYIFESAYLHKYLIFEKN